jgi:hypothetical protein
VAPTINGTTDLVYVGQRVTFTASGTDVRWGGDAPSVATVDATTGAVSGVGTGRVTIWAENAGGRTTRLLRVLPSYNGSWAGSYAINDCQSSGDFYLGQFCGIFHKGQILNMRLEISQSRDQVSGAFSLGDLQGTLAGGVVNENGSLPLSGTITSGDVVIQLQNARLTSPSPGTIKGEFDQVWASTALTGTGRLMCDIRDITRSSGAPAASALARGDANAALSLEELVEAVAVRR